MNSTVFSFNKLISSELLKERFTPAVLDGFASKEWIPRLIEQDLLKEKGANLYQNIAKLYGITYLDTLDVPLNPKETIAYRVPTGMLIEAQLYPFEKDGKLFIASSSPYIAKDQLNDVLSFTGRAGYEIV